MRQVERPYPVLMRRNPESEHEMAPAVRAERSSRRLMSVGAAAAAVIATVAVVSLPGFETRGWAGERVLHGRPLCPDTHAHRCPDRPQDVAWALLFLAAMGLVGVFAGSRLPEVSRR